MTAPRSPSHIDTHWYKDAIIYQIHVKAFGDSNGDGIGDFRGLTERLDYIQDLGVNTIWLLPFYPSPLRDDGYDIADYRSVHPHYGTRADFRNFVRRAHALGLRVITELVINHTSDQHPWFQIARNAPAGSARRNYYVWSDTDQKYADTRIIFTDTETSNWAWDPVAKAYFWHRFFSHQPDLNFANSQVIKEVSRVMRFWLDQGVDGFRLDAIPYLCEREGTHNENLPETHEVIRQLRQVIENGYQDRMFLAEANQWPEDVREYFGNGDECHMAYHFPLMPRMYMAVAQEDRHPVVEIMSQTPEIPDNCQWAIFLRNHDELTLEMVTDRERDYMYRTYANDPRMRINVGIRRRLAPLLDNDTDKIKLMNSLLLSMPGSPIIYYGDEIGMGDNIFLGDRNGVRTPMQWSPDRNAGFSRADPQRLYLPPIMDPVYGYPSVNVEAQSRDPSSLLNWMKRIIAVRQSSRAFGRGTLTILEPGNRRVLPYIREYEGETILCVANLSRSAQPVELDLQRFRGWVPIEMMGRTAFPPIGDLPYLLTLPGYAFYWFRLLPHGETPTWHEERLPPSELPVLVLFSGWQSFFPAQVPEARRPLAERLSRRLATGALSDFFPNQRWFGAKDARIEAVHFAAPKLWEIEEHTWLLSQPRVELEGRSPQDYFLPISLAWEADSDDGIRALGPAQIARVRQQSRMGILYDGFMDETFCQTLVRCIAEAREFDFPDGDRLRFFPTDAFAKLAGPRPDALPVHRPSTEGSNTAVLLGERLFLKAYRRLHEGGSVELEMERFLTEDSPFPHIAPLAGAVELERSDGATTSIALLQGFAPNQGDAWSHAISYLERSLEDALLRGASEQGDMESAHTAYLFTVATLGKRTGELHVALAARPDIPAFAPQPIEQSDIDAWCQAVKNDAQETLDRLERALPNLPTEVRLLASQVIAQRSALHHRASHLPSDLRAHKTRFHGDYHLGQVLVAEDNFVIIDFEGEPARSLEERRQKHSPLRDVAGMLRSFSYAAFATVTTLSDGQPEQFERILPLALEWERLASEAFLSGYSAAAKDSPGLPSRASEMQALLAFLQVEKVLYELRYELDNRPDWLSVPLRGLLRLL